MTEKKRKKLLICLHGSGDTGSGLRDWILSEDDAFEKRMNENDIDVAFPSAEPIPYSMANGMKMNVWFDRKGLGATFPEDKKGVRRSVDRIASSYSKLNYTDVAVLGFSQGGCLSLHLGLGPSSLRYVSDIYKRVRSQHTHTHTQTHTAIVFDLSFVCHHFYTTIASFFPTFQNIALLLLCS